jgi:hypothetical protein
MSMVNTRAGVELTGDRLFEHRIRRLVVISAVALGSIWGLAVADDASTWILVLLGIGWVLMPAVLAMSLRRPMARYALMIPASFVSIGLAAMTISAPGSTVVGWMLVTAGIVFGGFIGMWFWFRWLPVPRPFDDPFGVPRLALVGAHVGLVLAGMTMVAAGV